MRRLLTEQSVQRWKSRGMRLVATVTPVIRDLASHDLTLHATALVYTTLLSLVPLLAFSFSVLKGMGIHNQVEPLLLGYLAPLGESGEAVANQIIGFIDRMQLGVLGSLGLAMLVFTSVSLVHRVEIVFNRVWRISRPRPWARRVSDYVSTLVVGPVLVFSALGLTAAVVGSETFTALTSLDLVGPLIAALARLLPYGMVVAAFTFAYLFLPNTRVRPTAALVGALVAGFLWASLGWGFAVFVENARTYTAVYSGFAILILFMIWLFLSWLVLLIGADIAYHWQNPKARPTATGDLQPSWPGCAVVLAMCRLARRYESGKGPLSAMALAAEAGVDERLLRPLLDRLCDTDWVVRSERPRAGYLLAMPAARIRLDALLTEVDFAAAACQDTAMLSLRQDWMAALRERFGGRTLADVCGGAPAESGDEQAPEEEVAAAAETG